MSPLLIVTIVAVIASALACLLIVREFLHISNKRELLLQEFKQDVRGTKRSKSALIGIYVFFTTLWTFGFGLWFYLLAS